MSAEGRYRHIGMRPEPRVKKIALGKKSRAEKRARLFAYDQYRKELNEVSDYCLKAAGELRRSIRKNPSGKMSWAPIQVGYTTNPERAGTVGKGELRDVILEFRPPRSQDNYRVQIHESCAQPLGPAKGESYDLSLSASWEKVSA